MTTEQAKAEAHKRWGREGSAWIMPAWKCPYRVGLAEVTDQGFGQARETLGEGLSYEEAFVNADDRGGSPKAEAVTLLDAAQQEPSPSVPAGDELGLFRVRNPEQVHAKRLEGGTWLVVRADGTEQILLDSEFHQYFWPITLTARKQFQQVVNATGGSLV